MSKDNKQIDDLIDNLQKLKTADQKGTGFREIWDNIKKGFKWVKDNKAISSTIRKVRENPLYKTAKAAIPGVAAFDVGLEKGQNITEMLGVGGIINEKKGKGRGRPRKIQV